MSKTPHPHTNRLAKEKSPYLLQHAHNPVDWYPWGAEAFEKARREDRPVFLSVGYATCHWCHVMERESFENDDIAAILNREYVAIKVDREERPDVDAIYMNAVQAMTRHGGWPMSVWLTPEGKPFYGGTYFPPTDRQGMPGFGRLLDILARKWREDRGEIDGVAANLTEHLTKISETAPPQGVLELDLVRAAARGLAEAFDAEWGGFGGAPKFPRPATLGLLMRHWKRTADLDTLDMVTKTLDKMRMGGIYDHVGGGFARYSVDEKWMIPHFEKMLYDQAL
ncbi:MAG: thioredoxin domain-containing protein, partial [Myxococcales bacterium]|nr:thioredoxin domain-containing protein [Myxococcales bacterium]